MFSHDKQSNQAVCLEDYGRLKKGAIVPRSNELWADVEQWIAEGNEILPFDGYPEIPMTEEQLQDWRDNLVVSAFQAEQALADFGYLERVESIMSSPDTKEKTKRAWRKAKEFRRLSPTVLDFKSLLDMTDEQLDDLFKHGLTIEA